MSGASIIGVTLIAGCIVVVGGRRRLDATVIWAGIGVGLGPGLGEGKGRTGGVAVVVAVADVVVVVADRLRTFLSPTIKTRRRIQRRLMERRKID